MIKVACSLWMKAYYGILYNTIGSVRVNAESGVALLAGAVGGAGAILTIILLVLCVMIVLVVVKVKKKEILQYTYHK